MGSELQQKQAPAVLEMKHFAGMASDAAEGTSYTAEGIPGDVLLMVVLNWHLPKCTPYLWEKGRAFENT
jgi:hypothetical protein